MNLVAFSRHVSVVVAAFERPFKGENGPEEDTETVYNVVGA